MLITSGLTALATRRCGFSGHRRLVDTLLGIFV